MGAAAKRLAEAGIEVTPVVLPGRPLQRLIAYADEQKADLIVVGATSRAAVTERLLGSVPLDLIKHARHPVVVITRPGDR